MNSKKSTLKKGASTTAHVSHDWMTPVDPSSPCGADLEYDPEFVVLFSKVAAKADAQYGDFVGSPEPVNWGDVDRDCRRLMLRSKDMRLAVLFTRCRTRLGSVAGLAEGIGLLAAWLGAFPDAIHPQLGVDADREAALEIRMNALQALTDTDGLLSDLREIALTKSTAMRLQMRDVERAFAHPRPSDALAPESVTRQLEELRVQQPAFLAGFDDALASLAAIDNWSREHLGAYTPDFAPLTRLLRHVAGHDGRRVVTHPQPAVDDSSCQEEIETGTPEALSTPQSSENFTVVSPPPSGARGMKPADRHTALALIREARQWFEEHEPSSPIPVLLRRAERLVGKRFADVVNAIPGDLLVQWSSEES